MKVPVTILFICLTLSLSCLGCSKEEPAPPSVEKHKVVMPIKRAAPETDETGLPSKGEKTKEEAKEAAAAKTAAVEEKPVKPPKTETREKGKAEAEEAGCYTVKRGDTLTSISGREDVYGDPLKWPILYRHNMDKMGELQLVKDFLNRELTEGVDLRIITPDEARENLRRKATQPWTVNVLSATNQQTLISSAIRLMREGYPVYITSAAVKGSNWMRLRVGFFPNKTEAEIEGKKIMTLLSIHNSWVTEAGQKEFEEFGGY
jgi:hypothetical protein